MAETYVDADGREWLVRELVEYDTFVVGPDGFPAVARSTLVFECDGERRTADDAPIDWRDYTDGLAKQFAKATRLPPT
jgi:hypothetical protein